MKAAIAFLALSSLAQAQEKVNWQLDHAAALREAKKEGKYVVLCFSGSSPPEDVEVEAVMSSDAGLIEYLNKTFVNIRLCPDKDVELARKYGADTFPPPVLFILSPEGEILTRTSGIQLVPGYREWIGTIVIAHKELAALLLKLKASPNETPLLLEVADVYERLCKAGRHSEVARKAAELFAAAASRTGDLKAQGILLTKAFDFFYFDFDHAGGMDDRISKAWLELADRLDKLDPEGKLGFQADAAHARVIGERVNGVDTYVKGLERIMARWPDYRRAPQVLFTLSSIWENELHDKTKSEKFLREIVEKYPNSDWAPRSLFSLCELYQGGRDNYDPRAEQALKTIIEKYPQHAQYARECLGYMMGHAPFNIGREAPDFEATDTDGKTFKLSDYRGKVVVLDFWGFW